MSLQQVASEMLWGLARTSPSTSKGTRCTCCFPAEVWVLALLEAGGPGVEDWRQALHLGLGEGGLLAGLDRNGFYL